MQDCMFEFRLDFKGDIVLRNSEETLNSIMKKFYPLVLEAFHEAEEHQGHYTPEGW